MSTATVTSKGQITIPANVRSDLRVGPGDRVEFVKVAEGHWEVLAATEDVQRLRGMISPKRAVSIEEMNAAIRDKAGRE
ncbi:AbrB family looped-hinge helix DNA binding protein [Halospina denitrificans]|uniref:AbrB family looped-hinge helix DNA binding protein n=1 Tax=Halospina denitrificans TaxID=332522 RepID=A0A4R7JX32_9GAMM|nr:AbrB/MazE/SpoVT family DNA-binding domain-containing protein [Halospina denitrificans]TDT43022.1 AbrB family looped-hinge helix DNA binding protein [Halospina denitrificans]